MAGEDRNLVRAFDTAYGCNSIFCKRFETVYRAAFEGNVTNHPSSITPMTEHRNVLGTPLEICSLDPLTGYTREGSCKVIEGDAGVHGVCIVVTSEFLEFSESMGNDLSTPMPLFGFPGLQPGDRWCLCAPRWKEALEHGMAPLVDLMATHEASLAYASLEDLLQYSVGSGN